MARLTDAQIRKLTPAERKARDKRIAYGRAYDAAKKAGRPTSKRAKPQDKGMTRAEAKRAQRVADFKNALVAQIGAKLVELEALTERENELLSEIQALASSK